MPINLDEIKSGYNLSKINSNFKKIQEAWDTKLDRNFSYQGNQMNQDLDMNGNSIINWNFEGTGLDDAVKEAKKYALQAKESADDAEQSEQDALKIYIDWKNDYMGNYDYFPEPTRPNGVLMYYSGPDSPEGLYISKDGRQDPITGAWKY